VVDQVTPRLFGSLVTTATNPAAVPTCTVVVRGAIATEIAAAVMVTVADADFVGSVAEVAVIVTVPAVGMEDGAVYVVATPPAVCTGVNVPELALQLTPPFAPSLMTVAVNEAVPPAGSVVIAELIATEMLYSIVRLAETVLVGSVTDAAVIATTVPAVAAGAV
jgi:hypothetical protein